MTPPFKNNFSGGGFSEKEIFKYHSCTLFGTFAGTGNGICSWCDFATAIMQGAGLACKVEPVTSEQYASMNPASANRPAWSALDNRMLRCTVGDEMRDWQDALKDYFANWNGEL